MKSSDLWSGLCNMRNKYVGTHFDFSPVLFIVYWCEANRAGFRPLADMKSDIVIMMGYAI